MLLMGVGLVLGLVGVVYATNDVTRTEGASIVLPSDSSSYSIDSGTTVQSFTVNNSNIDFVVEGSSVITLTSGDKKDFNVSNNSQCSVTMTCGASVSNIFLTCPSNTAQQTITITPSGTCSAPSSGGGGGGAVYIPPSTPVVTPTVTATSTVIVPSAPVTAPATPLIIEAPLSVTPSVPLLVYPQPAPAVEFSNPDSAIQIKGLASSVFQQGASLKFTFQFKNESAQKIPVKITRKLLNSKGKVIKSSTLSTTLKADQLLKKTVAETISKTLPPGEYTEIIKIINSKTKELLAENSFKIIVEKLKKKTFVFAEEIPYSTSIAFDEVVWNKIKSNVVLPANFKFKYGYTNNTEQKQTVKMVRELIGPNEKVVSKKSGRWVMKPGETDSQTPTQAVAGNLAIGSYIVRIRAYDWKTSELLAENQFGFAVELK